MQEAAFESRLSCLNRKNHCTRDIFREEIIEVRDG